jgi:putative heme-binding domain-containing protein
MLRPVTQVGSKLDFEYPPETVTIVFKGSAGIEVTAGPSARVARVSAREARLTVASKQDQWTPLQISLKTGAGEPSLEVSWFTAEDPRPRALQLRRLFLPWATPAIDDSPSSAERIIPEIAGGDWKDGRKLFFSDQVACYKCHQVGGEGGKLGPDLSNLIHRDYASVMKDITQPSAAINPDHLAYNLELKEGEIVNGVILNDDPESTTIGLATGAPMKIAKTRIVGMKASAVSLMPENLLGGLDAQQRKSLLTFLLLPKP